MYKEACVNLSNSIGDFIKEAHWDLFSEQFYKSLIEVHNELYEWIQNEVV